MRGSSFSVESGGGVFRNEINIRRNVMASTKTAPMKASLSFSAVASTSVKKDLIHSQKRVGV